MVKWVSKLEAESVIDISGVVAVPSEGPVVSCTQKEVELVVHSVYCVSRSVPRLPFEARSTLVPVRPRRRGERRSLRTLPGASLRPGSLGFNPRPRRLSTPTDAFQLHPDIRSYRTTLIASDDGRATTTRKARRRASRSAPTTPRVPRAYLRLVRRRGGVHAARVLPLRGVPRREGVRGRRRDRGGVDAEVCSIHWSPYDSVRVVNADP